MPPPPFPMTLARRSAVAAVATVAASTTTPDDSSNSTSVVLQNDNGNNHISSSLNRDNSGNGNPNGSPPSSSSSPITTGTTTKYHPSIFRYTCRGRLTLDSMTTKNHAGICHGIQSQLEHVDHWRTTTEEEAIQWFQAKAAWNEGSTTTPAGPGGAPATASDAAGVGNTAAHALQTAHISNVLVYPSQLQQQPPSSSNNDNNNKYKNPHSQKLVAFAKNPSILPPTKEQWGCYGSTEIDLLVLRPQHSKEEKIVAVSPYCAPGMTIRDVTLPDTQGKERTSTIRLGILEILYQSTMEEDEDEEEEEVDELEDHDKVDDMAATNTATTTPTSNKDEEAMEEPVSNKSKKKKKRKQTNDDDDAESNKSFTTKFWKCSQNVWKHMQSNAHLLYQATQEDFVSRTMEASQKIVQEFPKTRDRTLNLMRKVILWDWDSPGGDDDDSPPTGGGPPPIV